MDLCQKRAVKTMRRTYMMNRRGYLRLATPVCRLLSDVETDLIQTRYHS
jgi:hypothetical protein